MCKFKIVELKAGWISSERTGQRAGKYELPVFDHKSPHFSWIMESGRENTLQTAWRAVVTHRGENGETITDWDSGKVCSDQSHDIIYSGEELRSFTEYNVCVRVWDNHGDTAGKQMKFETGQMKPGVWNVEFLTPEQKEPVPDERIIPEQIEDGSRGLTPCLYLRKELDIVKPVRRARAYATARGIYHLLADGVRLSETEFNPGFTAYDKYLEYQAYDLTELLTVGSHAIGVMLADGWYLGHIGVAGMNCQYGTRKSAFLELHIEYEDGEKEAVRGGDGWMFSEDVPLCYSDLFVGEKYDARKEMPGWAMPGFRAEGWKPVCTEAVPGYILRAPWGDPVRVIRRLPAQKVITTPKGETLIDFGQVLAGKIQITFRDTLPGQEIIMRHGEVLDEKGNYFHNIPGNYKDQRDVYICKGGEEEHYSPVFTFHGFRYVKIEGYSGPSLAQDAEALVIYSDMDDVGRFSCSDSRINQLEHNIRWSQYGNMLSIPTDCPQRERAGWTGDAQIYCETAALNMDVAAFFQRWLANMRLEQREDGQIPVVVPYHRSYRPENLGIDGKDGAAGWSDVIVMLPWEMYLAYGDISWLADNYDNMILWAEYERQEAEQGIPDKYRGADRKTLERQKYLWNTGFNFGDWLVPSLSSPDRDGVVDAESCMKRTKDEIATCYYAHSAFLISRIAEILGKENDRRKYRELFEKIREAFRQEYVRPGGRLVSDMQGTYVIALAFDMFEEKDRQAAAGRLKELIRENGGCLDTGFLSVNYLLGVLCGAGMSDVAYEILYQEKAPSWLYEVKQGATTVWEAWKAVNEKGEPAACSMNHYAFGCVGSFFYRRIAGLKIIEPGYRRFLVEPDFSCGLSQAKIRYRTVYGDIRICWEKAEDGYDVEVRIPVNTEAEILLPGTHTTAGSGSYRYHVEEKDLQEG